MSSVSSSTVIDLNVDIDLNCLSKYLELDKVQEFVKDDISYATATVTVALFQKAIEEIEYLKSTPGAIDRVISLIPEESYLNPCVQIFFKKLKHHFKHIFGSVYIPVEKDPSTKEWKADSITKNGRIMARYVLPAKEYHEVKDSLEMGSLAFVKGGEFVSAIIMTLQNWVLGVKDSYSHTGVLIDNTIIPIKNSDLNDIFIWESTFSYDKVKDVETKKTFFGVQKRDFYEVTQNYTKPTVVYPLRDNPLVQKSNETFQEFQNRISTYHLDEFNNRRNYSTYEWSCIRLPAILLSCMRPASNLLGFFWKSERTACSPFATEFLKRIEQVQKGEISEYVAPEDLLGFDNDGLNTPLDLSRPILIRGKAK